MDDNALQTIAAVGGCLYQGPTQITLVGTQMNVISPDTPASPSPGTNCPNPAAAGDTWTGVTGALPANGVVFVETASSANEKTGANPFDDSGTLYPSDAGKYAQTLPSCSGCYYGQTASPDEEADAFVKGHLSGLLTIGTANDVHHRWKPDLRRLRQLGRDQSGRSGLRRFATRVSHVNTMRPDPGTSTTSWDWWPSSSSRSTTPSTLPHTAIRFPSAATRVRRRSRL